MFFVFFCALALLLFPAVGQPQVPMSTSASYTTPSTALRASAAARWPWTPRARWPWRPDGNAAAAALMPRSHSLQPFSAWRPAAQPVSAPAAVIGHGASNAAPAVTSRPGVSTALVFLRPYDPPRSRNCDNPLCSYYPFFPWLWS